ncbi:MAG: hypothetical protein GOV01_00650 [Candidatus Altiarchaeota archaeon]|nr:hypothetical protein [Candidatus Altiarchaeota archaeon]
MLTVALLIASAALAFSHPNLARWSGILSFLFINDRLHFEWLPGIEFTWDPAYHGLVFAFSLVIFTAISYARNMKKSQVSMLLLFSAGLLGFIGVRTPFEVFFFLELMIFPAFYLILTKDKTSAFKYFGFMQVSSVLVLAGLIGSGTIASILLTIGFAIKMGLFPFHSWLPDAHSHAPFQLSALLSGAVVACGAYGILQFSTTRLVLLPIGIISAIYGAVSANGEPMLKRLLAYSTVSQMGYAAIALAVVPEIVPLFLIMHALAKSSLFFSSGEIIKKTGFHAIRKIGISSKTTFISMLVSSMSLAGLPPLLGFTTELTILKASWLYSPLAGIFFAFAIFPTILYSEKLLSMFFKRPHSKFESALPLILALMLISGVIPWMSS